MIEKVEVLEGGEALFYGTSALAGVVNIVTEPFSDSPSGPPRFGGHRGRRVAVSAPRPRICHSRGDTCLPAMERESRVSIGAACSSYTIRSLILISARTKDEYPGVLCSDRVEHSF